LKYFQPHEFRKKLEDVVKEEYLSGVQPQLCAAAFTDYLECRKEDLKEPAKGVSRRLLRVGLDDKTGLLSLTVEDDAWDAFNNERNFDEDDGQSPPKPFKMEDGGVSVSLAQTFTVSGADQPVRKATTFSMSFEGVFDGGSPSGPVAWESYRKARFYYGQLWSTHCVAPDEAIH
jgi:hypothetical protein